MSNSLRGTKNTFLFDGSGTTGSFIADPTGTGVFYFTLTLRYGSFSGETQTLSAPSVLPPLPPNIPVSATLINKSTGSKISAMELIEENPYPSGNGFLGTVYTFETPALSSGQFAVQWETPQIIVPYGAGSLIILKPMNGISGAISASNLPSDRIGVVGTIDPQTVVNTEVFSDVVDMNNFDQACFILLTGDMANETVTFRVVESATSGGTYTLVTGKSKAYTASATANDNVQCQINLKASELSSGMKFVKAGAVTGGASGGMMAVVALGLKPVSVVASDLDIATNTIV
jgi:hypothetical protein